MNHLMTARAFAASLVLALTLGACATSAVSSATPTPTASPATSTPTAPPATTAPSTPAPAIAGVITGRVLYPAGMIPAVTVYAINVADQARSFFVQRPRFAEGQGPDDRANYSITGVAPGTYYVVAWRDSDPTSTNQPGLYSQFVVRCVQPSMAGVTPLPPECGNSVTGDHSLVPVTVRAGETVTRIEVGDWGYGQASYPPRPAR